jgi:hypothetical protein
MESPEGATDGYRISIRSESHIEGGLKTAMGINRTFGTIDPVATLSTRQ